MMIETLVAIAMGVVYAMFVTIVVVMAIGE